MLWDKLDKLIKSIKPIIQIGFWEINQINYEGDR